MVIDEKLVEKYMKSLELSRDEAIQLIKDDELIDKGEKLFELSPEQKAVEKKMRSTGTRKVTTIDAYGKKRTRTQKEDTDKTELINALKEMLENLQITDVVQTKAAQLDFSKNGRKFRIVLSAPRK